MLCHALVAAWACAPALKEHMVYRPANATGINAFYNAALTEPGLQTDKAELWPGARQPALDALRVFRQYITISTPLPPLTYVESMEDNAVGKYFYDDTQSFEIQIVGSRDIVSASLEFYVVLHELLHFAGFGNIHGNVDNARVVQNWHREFSSTADPIIKTHWETVLGTHRRLGTPATAEVMTVTMTGDIFLSATTLLACTRNTISKIDVCINSSDCATGTCVYENSRLPGMCSHSTPHAYTDSTTWVNIFAFVLVGMLFIFGYAVFVTQL